MNFKKFALLLLVVILLVSVSGCKERKDETTFVTLVTGSTGGTYYPVGTIFSTLWNAKLADKGVVASVQSSGGSVENLNMLKNEEAQLGIAMANLTLFAYEGSGNFEGNQFEDVRFVTALWPDVTQFVVTENSGVNSLADLKGKKFNVGSAGSGTEHSSKVILKAVAGLSFDDIVPERLGYFEASSAIQNAQIVGMNAEGGLPTAAVAEIAASRTKIKILEFSDEDYQKIKEVAPYYGRFIIPANLYSGVDREINTVGIKSALITSAKLDDELVYNLTKELYENIADIRGDHKALDKVTIENALKGLPPVPLHAGAIKFYEEKGIEIPEHLR